MVVQPLHSPLRINASVQLLSDSISISLVFSDPGFCLFFVCCPHLALSVLIHHVIQIRFQHAACMQTKGPYLQRFWLKRDANYPPGAFPYRMKITSIIISLQMPFHKPAEWCMTCSPFMKCDNISCGSRSISRR